MTKFERQYGSEERVRRIGRMHCVACGGYPCHNAHVRSRGAGGTWRDIVPLCASCHREQHRVGILTFQDQWDIDLGQLAAELAEACPP